MPDYQIEVTALVNVKATLPVTAKDEKEAIAIAHDRAERMHHLPSWTLDDDDRLNVQTVEIVG